MNYLNSIISDLRERRLWPLALVLLVGIVAVPVLLSKSSAKVPVAAAPQGSGTSASVAGLPVVSVSGLPDRSRLTGKGRDPFTQQQVSSGTSTTSIATTPSATGGTGGTSTTGGTGGTTGTTGTTGATTGGTTTTGPGTTTTPSTPILPEHPAKPAPSGLSSTEAYDVTVSITQGNGNGVDKIGALERLGTLPQGQQSPLLVELGVLKGGRRVLFAVQPGAVLQGPGTCTPGPINCQIMSLAPDQIESLSRNTTTGVVSEAMFAVTAITAHRYSSSAQAKRARTKVSSAGRRLLTRSNASALSLFPYRPGLGAVVDLRDLTIGGK